MRGDLDAVERVIDGLRAVEVPAGLEERVLRGMEARVAAGAGARRRRLGLDWLGGRGWAGAACGVGALAVCLVVFGVHRGVGHPGSEHQGLERRAVQAGLDVGGVSAPPMAASLPLVKSAPVAGRRAAVRVRVSVGRGLAEGGEALAVAEMRAPSMPAPPLPLTREERLLQRVVAKGAPEEIAMLDPVQRERAEADGKAEVERFFDPPKPKVEERE